MKTVQLHYLASLLIVASVVLAVQIPNGPFEHRDLSHIAPPLLLAIQGLLALLALTALLLSYGVWRGHALALTGTIAIGGSYFLIYAVDLAGWFPASPTPMSGALLSAKIAGLLLAIPLTRCACQAYHELTDQRATPVLLR